MFGFSKKKGDGSAQNAQAPNQAVQSTKIEDDMASFEIPDFSDDDLNFDLGIGEFMPKGDLNSSLQPAPKGLPTSPEEAPVPQQKDVPAPTMQNTEDEVPAPIEMPEQKSASPKLTLENKYAEEKEKLDNLEPEQEAQSGEDSDELPKFSIGAPVNLDEESPEEVPKQFEEESVVKKNKQKKEAHKESKQKVHAPKEEKHYAQESSEGFFVPGAVYKKIVILSEDVRKHAVLGEDLRKNYCSILKSKKEAIAEAEKEARFIRDSIMSADAKLFEER